MASFAELDSNNIVLGIYKFDNLDILNFGSEPNDQAVIYIKNIRPLSENAVKYVQTFYSNSHRQRIASVGGSYDPIKDVFINPKPHNSWILNSNNEWIAPIPYPSTLEYISNNETYVFETVFWDENLGTFKALEIINDPSNKNTWTWNKDTLIWTIDSN